MIFTEDKRVGVRRDTNKEKFDDGHTLGVANL